MAKTPSDHTRRVHALLKKTTFNGCTPGEAASALYLASTLVTKHRLSPTEFTWPEPPAGWRWEGEHGRGGTVVEKPESENAAEPKAKPARKPKQPTEPKPKRATNGERMAEMAARPDGFTIEDIMEALSVQRHTARALISVELSKRRGRNVVMDKETKRYRVMI